VADGVVQSSGKEPIAGDDALSVLRGVKDLYVAKGKKVVHLDLAKNRPPDDELLALLVGRSGGLRAPTLKSGTTLVVGYNADVLEQALG
jgi:arsenate reductase-like glutaredoxin family protein